MPRTYFQPATRCPACGSKRLSPAWKSRDGDMEMHWCYRCTCHFGISRTVELPSMPINEETKP